MKSYGSSWPVWQWWAGSDVNKDKRQVRVIRPDSGQTSGWLYVLQRGEVWLPKINELVLVLYLPVFGGDGFILGGLAKCK